MTSPTRLAALAEAERDTRKDRDVSSLESRLAVALRSGFFAQQRDLLARLQRRRGVWFIESAVLREAVPPGEFDGLWDAVQDATSGPMEQALQRGAEAGVLAGGRSAQVDLSLTGSFDLAFPGAVEWLRGHGAERIKGINATTRERVREVLVQGASEGWSYSQTAKELRGLFDGFRVPDPRLHIRDRAELIAVTEVGEAYEAGRQMVIDSLTAQGVATEKRWLTAGDERVCPICEPNGLAEWIGSGEAFPSGHAHPLGHPACRCDLLVRVAELVPALA